MNRRRPNSARPVAPKPRRKQSAPVNQGVGGLRLIRVYFTRHAQNLFSALGRMVRQPIGSLLTVTVIGIALCLPAGLHLLVVNGKAVTSSWDSAVDLTVYLKPGLPPETAKGLAGRLEKRLDVASVEVIPAAQALVEFRELSGFGEALEALTENPLPDVLVIRPAQEDINATQVKMLADELTAWKEIDLVQVDTAWVERFHALLAILRRAVSLAAAVLAVGVVVIVGNTIRLDIQNRKSEIEVCKLIGASDAFIRRPFLYSGLWYGLGGAVIALLVVNGTMFLLQQPIRQVAGLYGSNFELTGLDLGSVLLILAGGSGLGWLGSWLAATRHMRL
ncbi:MAG: permease-like cell division protein FtsX, partial [Gammaproteobacteria bacterium]|nr:permease-like cell division protein FtsX [Gammaproteobacteria bacterium]